MALEAYQKNLLEILYLNKLDEQDDELKKSIKKLKVINERFISEKNTCLLLLAPIFLNLTSCC